MAESIIRRIDEEDPRVGDFIHEGFTRYGEQNGVVLNYDGFCFAAEIPAVRTITKCISTT